MLLIPGTALALTADYRISPDGSAYQGSVELVNASQYSFAETGLLGERLPVQVSNVTLLGKCFPPPCTFTWSDRFTISFPEGNYTLQFVAPLRQNTLVAAFPEPYTVVVRLPPGFDVRNYLIGSMSAGARVTEATDGSLTVTWNATRSAELRFYTEDRVTMLALFGQFWIVIAIVLLLPFLFSRRMRQ